MLTYFRGTPQNLVLSYFNVLGISGAVWPVPNVITLGQKPFESLF